jgi:hypothetical protein
VGSLFLIRAYCPGHPTIESLKESAEQLSGAVVPLGRIAERLPGSGGRRRGNGDAS